MAHSSRNKGSSTYTPVFFFSILKKARISFYQKSVNAERFILLYSAK